MTIWKRFITVLAVSALSALTACGGGSSSESGTPPFGEGSGSDGGGGTPTEPVLSISLQLLDNDGVATTTVTAGQPLRAKAVLTLDGVPQASQIMAYSTEQSVELVKIDPTAASVLTDANGAGTVTVSALGANTGAGRIVATASVETGSGSTAVTRTATATANFFTSGSGTTPPATLTLSALDIGSTAVSAYGTTGVRVRVLQGGDPFTSPATVNFTTSCPAGKASITSSATTQPDGWAVATFTDNGCAPTSNTAVTVTASIATDSESGSLTVRAPSTGSLRFISVDPSDKSITLRGQGGNGRQENATVTFRLVDVAGQGVGDADVCFDVTTYIGGLNLDGFSPSKLPSPQGSNALCGTDNLSLTKYVKRTGPDGTVTVQINSGTVPTPVRLRARALYPASATSPLETFSDTLSISTGLPLQRSFSLSVNQANIDGGSFDGEVATFTARLADQFSNPVPDGTVVNFIASGAAICTADNGSCKTTNGACSCALTSQASRPIDGRVIVLAYAVGLEDYEDSNGNNVYDRGETFYDLGDAYIDANKDGKPTSTTINGDTDTLIPYQSLNGYRAKGDGVRGTAHIRSSAVVYLSQASSAGQPTLVIPDSVLRQENSLTSSSSSNGRFLRLKPTCPSTVPLPQASLSFVLEDGVGNPMAAGTDIAAVDATNNVAPDTPRPSAVLAIGARAPSPSIDLPNQPKAPWTSTDANGSVVTGHGIAVRGVVDKCAGEANFGIEVKSPRGAKALAAILYEGEARSDARFSVDVRYRDTVGFTLAESVTTARRVDLTPNYWVGTVGSTGTEYRIDWGDGTADSTGTLPMANLLSHTYVAAYAGKVVSVRLSITTSAGTLSETRSLSLAP